VIAKEGPAGSVLLEGEAKRQACFQDDTSYTGVNMPAGPTSLGLKAL